MPTSNASNKSNEDSFFREGTRVIFVWFGALRMAFFIVSPVKQTVAIATFASQITIKTTTKKRTRKGRPIPKGSNYNVSLPDDNLESASFAHVAPNSSTQLVFISHISTWPMGTSRPVNSHSNTHTKKIINKINKCPGSGRDTMKLAISIEKCETLKCVVCLS